VAGLGAAPPPSGGLDVDLPGLDIKLGATRWPGHGTPIVLLHGLSSQRRFWNLVVPHLVGSPLLALDQRGHGDSDRPAAGYDLETVAGDLATAMDALGWSRAVIVGHSWGGAVAATFAARHPERSLALVCLDGGFASPSMLGSDRATTRRLLEPPRIASAPDELVQRMRDRAAGTWSEEFAAAVLPIFEVGDDGLARPRLPFDRHMTIVDTLLDYDAPATLAAVRCPTWVVACESSHDAAALGEAAAVDQTWSVARVRALQRVVDVLPEARISRWGGAVHDVPLQWPALVAGLVRGAAADAAQQGQDSES
jgi:pimeloyl-ACP methyl ester carboxylesterase